MRKRVTSLVSCFVLLALISTSIIGCGTNANTENSGAEKPAATDSKEMKGVTISVAAKQDWIKDIDKQMADEFTKSSGIEIEFQVTPNDQYDNVIRTKLATGEAPDIYYGDAGLKISKYNPEAYSADLSNEAWVANYTDDAKKANSYKGKVYGLNTWASDVWGIMYDTKLFEKYNIKEPTSWDEFLAVCETLKQNGITPLYENGKDTWHWPGFFTTSGAVIEKNNPGTFDKINSGEKKFGDFPEFEKALANLKTLNDKGYFSEDVLAETWGNQEEALASGKYGMFLVWSSFGSEIVTKFPDAGPVDRWKMFSNPVFGDLKIAETSIGGISRYANNKSKNLDAVKLYFNFLASHDNLEKYYKGSPNLAAIKPFKDIDLPTNPALKSYLANGGDVVNSDIEAKIDFINGDLLAKGIQDMMLGGKTPKQVIEYLDNDREKTLKTVSP